MADLLVLEIGPGALLLETGNFLLLETYVDAGTSITNASASTARISNINACGRTGFRQYPGELLTQWDGVKVRKKSYDGKHPQEMVRSTQDKRRGSVSPEQTDSFLSTNEVTAESL